jgi:hypothetical protein
MTLLGQQAKEHIKKYIDKKLPFEIRKHWQGCRVLSNQSDDINDCTAARRVRH